MKTTLFTCILVILQISGSSESTKKPLRQPSPCHMFVDHENIWTLEILEENGELVPILNIITLASGEWEFRPYHIHIYNSKGEEVLAKKFSMSLGDGTEPYISQYLKVRGNSVIGLDLLGQFEGFSEPLRVHIDLGSNRFELEPLHCTEFDSAAKKIDKINFNSPNIQEDFEVLRINLLGKISARNKE